MKNTALLVMLFYKNGGWALAALKKFWALKHMKKGCDPTPGKDLKEINKKYVLLKKHLAERENQLL